jgi:hypothetical protein
MENEERFKALEKMSVTNDAQNTANLKTDESMTKVSAMNERLIEQMTKMQSVLSDTKNEKMEIIMKSDKESYF